MKEILNYLKENILPDYYKMFGYVRSFHWQHYDTTDLDMDLEELLRTGQIKKVYLKCNGLIESTYYTLASNKITIEDSNG